MTATRILLTSFILLCLIGFGRSVHAQDASNDEVKKFGQHMVDEHSKMLDEGKQVARSKGVKPRAGPDKKH